MADQHLATYLNGHLAGAAAALALLEQLEEAHTGTDTGRFVARLRADIAADRQELEAVMARLRVAASAPRKAAAWLGEKMAELKLRLDDRAAGAFRLSEALEGVSAGIEGKHLLWRALAALTDDLPDLRGTDYGRLERRALEQRQRLEPVRLKAAKAAHGSAQAAARS
jgi:hypothetical protein